MEFIKKPVILLTKEEKEVVKNLAKVVDEYCETGIICHDCPFGYDGICGKSIFFSGLIKISNYSET